MKLTETNLKFHGKYRRNKVSKNNNVKHKIKNRQNIYKQNLLLYINFKIF